MSNRLAFQTQLASIMEVLANAAVAEICKLVDDDYAVVSLQMSQCQRENKALKRKLHLLELKMARGNAERRLRESAMNGGRARVQLNINDRLRINSPSTAGAEFETQMAVVQWHGRSTLEGNTNKLSHSNIPQSKSPDVELVQPDLLLVKEERVDFNMVQLENMDGDQPLIGSDGVVEHVSRGAAGHRAELKELNKQCCFTNQTSRNSRAEVSDDSSQLKFEPDASVEEKDSPTQSLNPLFADDNCKTLHNDMPSEVHNLAIGDVFNKKSLSDLQGTESCSYSMAAIDFPSTSSNINGWAHYKPGFTQPTIHRGRGRPFQQGGRMDRHYVCTFCGKAFNRPKKLEIHQRVHTGERPFSCSTCGKMFAEAGNLKKHQRVHTGEQPYTCVLCGKGFAWIRNLKTHQYKSHPEIYPEMET